MTITILIVEKTGVLKEHILKNFVEAELYKKAGFKSGEGFACQTEWNIDNGDNDKSYSISVYGKTTGRAGQENKYEFPPPIDNTLFFGSCVIVNKKGNEAASISAKEWETVYEYLFGGFEDIGEEDSEYEEEEEEVDETQLTKSGYLKDDFIVDDEDIEEEEEDEEEEDEDADDDEEVFVSKKKSSRLRVASRASVAVPSKKGKKAPAIVKPALETSYLDCTSELSEEEYMA